MQGSVAHLPFEDESFEVVLSFDVLYCLEAPAEQSALQEMFRVLKPDGFAVINVAALEHIERRSLGAWWRSPPLHEARASRESSSAPAST